MNYLSHYTEAAHTDLLDDTGAFFAFSNKQFDESKVDGIKYASCGAGLICPKENVSALAAGLKEISKKGIKADLAENGKKAIIHRELANYESQISMDISDTVAALYSYPITRDEIQSEWAEYWDNCVENDLF